MAITRGERHTTRPFAAGALAFAVETGDDNDRQLVESLFNDLPQPSAAEQEIAIFSLFQEDAGGRWLLGSPRSAEKQIMPSLDAALSLLIADMNLCSLDAEPAYLHLHAAAATREGLAVVIAAERNTGKSTTVAHLVAHGWGFVTDETVRLAASTNEVTGFAKPLSIKPGGCALVEHLEPWMVPPITDGPRGSHFVPMGASGATVADGGLAHLVIVLQRPPRGTPETDPEALRLHPADAVVALMQQTLDAERFGSAAVRLAELAATCHCFELTIGSPADTADTIESLFGQAAPEPLDAFVLPPSNAFTPGVTSVAIGDRTVVHDTRSGRIFALDTGGARVWKQLGGWNPNDEIDLSGPVIAPFVAQLRAFGVLAGAA